MSQDIHRLLKRMAWPKNNPAYLCYLSRLFTKLQENNFRVKLVGSRASDAHGEFGRYSISNSDIDIQVEALEIGENDDFNEESLTNLVTDPEVIAINKMRWVRNKLQFYLQPYDEGSDTQILVEIVVLGTWYVVQPFKSAARATYPDLMYGVPTTFNLLEKYHGVPRCKLWDSEDVYTYPIKVSVLLEELSSSLDDETLSDCLDIMRTLCAASSASRFYPKHLKLNGVGMLTMMHGISKCKNVFHTPELLSFAANLGYKVVREDWDGVRTMLDKRSSKFSKESLKYLDILNAQQLTAFFANLNGLAEMLLENRLACITNDHLAFNQGRTWNAIMVAAVVARFLIFHGKKIQSIASLLDPQTWDEIFDMEPFYWYDLKSGKTFHFKRHALKAAMLMWLVLSFHAYEQKRVHIIARKNVQFYLNQYFLGTVGFLKYIRINDSARSLISDYDDGVCVILGDSGSETLLDTTGPKASEHWDLKDLNLALHEVAAEPTLDNVDEYGGLLRQRDVRHSSSDSDQEEV